MNFSILSDCHKKWWDILVIGKSIERAGRKYHILGMTLSDESRLYIIEPYDQREPIKRKGSRNNRRILKEHEQKSCCYLHCSEFYLSDKRLQVQGGTGGSLKYSLDDYGTIQLFLDMISAGYAYNHNPQSGFHSAHTLKDRHFECRKKPLLFFYG